MYAFVDNTGIHAVGRCLDGISKRGEEDADVKGLLQFASLLVFCNRIYVSEFEEEGIRSRTSEIVANLNDIGVEKNLVQSVFQDARAFAALAPHIANNIADDISFLHVPSSGYSLSPRLVTPDIRFPDDDFRQYAGDFLRSMTEETVDDDVAKSFLSNRSGGGMHYLIYGSERLRNKLRESKEFFLSTGNHSASLVTHFRCRMNQHFAAHCSQSFFSNLNEVWYIPSISRAHLIAEQTTFLLDKLNDIVGEAAMKLNQRPLPAPPVAAAIALRSKGEPIAVVQEALRSREKASDLRAHLAKVTLKMCLWDGQTLLFEELQELSRSVRQFLRIEKKPGIFGALTVDILGVSLGTTFDKIGEYFNSVKSANKAVVLGEFAKTIADFKIDPFIYKKLVKAAGRNRAN